MTNKNLIYMASPYSHMKFFVMEARFEAACMAAGYLMRQGKAVFSPIAHSHPIHRASALPNTYDFWVEGQDLHILKRCDELIVLTLPGWEDSKGIQAEITSWREGLRHYDKLNPITAGIPDDIIKACGG